MAVDDLTAVPTIAVCTAFYPQADAIAQQYGEGLSALAGREGGIALIAAVEQGTDLESFLPSDRSFIELYRADANGGATPVDLRRQMLETGVESGIDVLLFCDCDDIISPDAGEAHRSVLKNREISFGDLDLIDEFGSAMGRRMFDGLDVPSGLENADGLVFRNMLGLSNTAVRRAFLDGNIPFLPQTVTAVDWLLFTILIDQGGKAGYAQRAVGSYRQYASNTLGAGPGRSVPDLMRRIGIARCHFAALPETDTRRRAARLLAALAGILETAPDRLVPYLANPAIPGFWFEDVFRLAAWAEAEGLFGFDAYEDGHGKD